MCDSCEVVRINGVLCHEAGCPDAWRDRTRECDVCGCDFLPEGQSHWQCPDCRESPEDEHDPDYGGAFDGHSVSSDADPGL